MSDTLWGGVAPTTTAPGGNPGANQGVDFTAQHTGTVDSISWWQPPAGGPAAATGVLYDTQTGAVVASQVAGALTPNAWNVIPFATPPQITPGRLYTASVFTSPGSTIGFTPGLLAGHTFSGDLTAPLRTGRFDNGAAAAFPPLNVGTDAFGVDLTFTSTPTCPECPPCPPTEGFFINLTGLGLIPVVTGVGGCIIGALEQTPAGAPCRRCYLVPTSTFAWDNCGPCEGDGCTGAVQLAIREVYGSETFPQPMNGKTWTKCGPRWLVARVGVSVTRCLPGMDKNGTPPTCEAELAAAITLENDRTATRQAIACCLTAAFEDPLRPGQALGSWLMGPATTLEESGNCGGFEVEFFVGIPGGCLCPPSP